ncbi:MAG TPA: helix-turn-helix transcriptional regulator [Bacilli bacterium]|nr:helix-turn-helix transcriptional regulator [Bacilli bacterium]
MRQLKLELNNSIVRVMYLGEGASDPLHTHKQDYQISVPLSGTPQVEHNGKVVALPGDTRLVTSPSESHRHFAADGESKLLLISLQRTFLQDVLAERVERTVPDLEFTPFAEGSSLALQKVAEKIIAGSIGAPLSGMEWQELEVDLAHWLLSLHPGSHSGLWLPQTPHALHPALQTVLAQMHDEHALDLSLDDLAEAAGVSKYHLIRLFREQFGQTPAQYLTELRLRRAVEMLVHTGREITDVALSVGFGSLSSFHRAFKNKFGVTASAYRKDRGMNERS